MSEERDSATPVRSGSANPTGPVVEADDARRTRLLQRSREALADGGALARALPGFIAREPQQTLAARVADACLKAQAHRVIEAPTGVGKTFGYLVPVLLSGRRVLISTGTKNLQDQLFEQDLPQLVDALGVTTRVALLKGRRNYLCHERLEQLQQSHAGSRDALSFSDRRRLQALEHFAATDASGDLSRAGILADAPVEWGERVTSTTENCLGSACAFYNEDCFVARARRAAQDADVVVINHHLLLADLALREQGFAELLPKTDVVIVDEAHQLPDLAAQYFGLEFGTRAVSGWLKDLAVLARSGKTADARVADAAAALQEAVVELEIAWPLQPAREARANLDLEATDALLAELSATLATLVDVLIEAGKAAGEYATQAERGRTLTATLAQWQQPGDGMVSWFERSAQSVLLHVTPIDAARPLAVSRKLHAASWVFVSATLAVGDRFVSALKRLGLPSSTPCEVLPSVFDHDRQARLLLAPERGLPPHDDPEYLLAWMRWIWPLLRETPGGVFLLFTSHDALRRAAEVLRDHVPENREMLVQGEALERGEMLERFRLHGRAWLLGTQSFWEGVNIKGEALTTVIIDKLPFPSPRDPVIAARMEQIREEQKSDGKRRWPFGEVMLPVAVLGLRQGMGRLIRTLDDRGLVVICDPRLTSGGVGYATGVLNALPPMPRLHDVRAARAYLKTLDCEPARESACDSAGEDER